LSPVIEDRLTTTLTNTVLRRRDILPATGQGRQLQDNSIVDLRSSPLVGVDLLDFPLELVVEERELKSSRTLLDALKCSARPSYDRRQNQPFWQSAQPSAAARSAAQLQQQQPSSAVTSQPSTSQQQSFPVQYTSYKARRGASKSFGGRGKSFSYRGGSYRGYGYRGKSSSFPSSA